MTLIRHELRQGRTPLLIWTAAIGFLLAICVFLFPEMKGQMEGVSKIFASMGSFTAAFGMDRLNFGTMIGFYAVECGNIMGLGGAFYASLCAVGMLSKEEKDHTAEFLLVHPVSRVRVITDKLITVLLQITAMNIIVYGLAVGAIAAVVDRGIIRLLRRIVVRVLRRLNIVGGLHRFIHSGANLLVHRQKLAFELVRRTTKLGRNLTELTRGGRKILRTDDNKNDTE